jgi:competence protein ComEA
MELLAGIGVGTRRLVALALTAAVVAVLLWRHGAHAQTTALRVAPVRVAAAGARSGAAARTAPLLVVDVAGAVRRPGLVRVGPGSRVADAVARAGGFTRRADQAGVNLAAPVSDGQQVLVPERGAGGVASGGSGPSGASGAGPVSLSAASAEQLDALPGIGPVTAQKIVAYRQQHGAFHSVDELDAIPGIGPARLADLQGLVVP